MNGRMLLVAGLVAGLAGCDTKDDPKPDAGAPPTKVGFIYVGPIADYGWTKSHEDGRQYLENYGTNVKTAFRESVLPDQAAAKIKELYDEGNKIIFATSFDFLQPAMKAPETFSDLWMMTCSGFQKAPRAGNYMGRLEEPQYLAGMIAGKLTKTNKIGVVGAFRIHEQIMHLNAFALGVRSVNPAATIHVRWAGYWFNIGMEEQAVKDLINEGGVDVIQGMTDTNKPILTSDAMKTPGGATVWSIGMNNKNYCNNATNGTCLASAYFTWGPYYKKVVDEIVAKTYPEAGRIDYLGSKDMDIVGIEMSDKVPADVVQAVKAKQDEITQQKFNVFQGPFKNAAGAEWKKAGEKLTDCELDCMVDYVEGVSDFPGPACTTDDDCTGKNALITLKCDTTAKKCVAVLQDTCKLPGGKPAGCP